MNNGHINATIPPALHSQLWDQLRKRRYEEHSDLTMSEMVEYYIRRGMAAEERE